MAQVFVAQKEGSPDVCVLKQLLVELESHATAGRRFHREAHVASYLQHPNIARTLDAGEQDGAFCIAVEFIQGKDAESLMHHLMRQGRMLPYEVSLTVGLAALEGLAYAHRATDPAGTPLELVHRDLSPRNVMLGFGGEVKIIDFGLARGRLDDFRTAPGMILGTLRYASPEQAVAEQVTARSDLYSLAVVLYEMFSGRPLISDGKPLEVLTQVVNQVAEPITRRNARLPPALDAVFERALRKDPAERYPTAEALAAALRAAAAPIQTVPPNVLGRFVADQFPEDRERAERLVAEGRARFERLQSAMIAGEAARVVPGHTGAAPTRLGGVSPLPMGLRVEDEARNVETRAAMRDELGQATRTVVLDTLGGASSDTGDDLGGRTRTARRDELGAETRLAPAPEATTRTGHAAWGATEVGPVDDLGATWVRSTDAGPTRLGAARAPAAFVDPSEVDASTFTRLGDTRLLASPFGPSPTLASGHELAPPAPPPVGRGPTLAIVGVMFVTSMLAAWILFGGRSEDLELEPLVEAPLDALSPPAEVGAVAAVGEAEAAAPIASAPASTPSPPVAAPAATPRVGSTTPAPRPTRTSAAGSSNPPSPATNPPVSPNAPHDTSPAVTLAQAAKPRAQLDDEARASALCERARRLILRHGSVVNPRELSDADRDALAKLALEAEQLAKKVGDDQVRTRIRVGLDAAYQGRLEELERALVELRRALSS
jgi:hypothetical protein